MSEILDKDPLFIFVFTFLMPYRDLSLEFKFNLVDKICNKLIRYGHDKKNSDIKELYVRYYISGYLNSNSFDQIISDGTFHLLNYHDSKQFFIEVYYGNGYLMKKFYNEKQYSAFSSQEAKKEYLDWLEDNFKVFYSRYHKKL